MIYSYSILCFFLWRHIAPCNEVLNLPNQTWICATLIRSNIQTRCNNWISNNHISISGKTLGQIIFINKPEVWRHKVLRFTIDHTPKNFTQRKYISFFSYFLYTTCFVFWGNIHPGTNCHSFRCQSFTPIVKKTRSKIRKIQCVFIIFFQKQDIIRLYISVIQGRISSWKCIKRFNDRQKQFKY